MAGSTTKGFPYPSNADPVDIPGDIQNLASTIDSYLTNKVLPSHTGNAKKVLASDGTSPVWVDDPEYTEIAIIMGAF